MLKEKYQSVLDVASKLGVRVESVAEEGGKLKIKGFAPYQLEKDFVWDKVKTISGWETELVADIRVENTDLFGIYTVQSGDTLSRIAKGLLGNSTRYMEIFNANKDILKDPNMIKVGQKLKIPKV